ncbi:MAG TPA: sulfite oxidase [Gaiellales bacterium]|nr:sulfite oxidase [Gaiellales bacterium]
MAGGEGLEKGVFSEPEIRLAMRNHGMPLEALRDDLTPPGLHYLLTHFDIPAVDLDTWTLAVDGLVEHSLSLSMADLRVLPQEERTVTMECAGNGRSALDRRPVSQPWVQEAIGTACWAGVPVSLLLERAGVEEGAVEAVFSSLDHGIDGGIEQHYQRSLTLELARSAEPIVAIAMNDGPLPPQHGFPARLLVPGWYGMTNVKWLSRITLVDAPFEGYQQAIAYRVRQTADEPGEAITRMLPRALMVPPGIPDFASRDRIVMGPCTISGRAWSGWGAIERVDVSTDGGGRWQPATLDQGTGDGHARWCSWSHRWDAPDPGEHVLMARARDTAGNEQPDQPDWNAGGYLNNAVQRVRVTVRGG